MGSLNDASRELRAENPDSVRFSAQNGNLDANENNGLRIESDNQDDVTFTEQK